MNKTTLYLAVLFTTIHLSPAQSLDDFLTPVTDEPENGRVAPTKISDPGAVRTSSEQMTAEGERTPVVQAANTQDAINAAVAELERGDGDVVAIKVGSGFGIVALGRAAYEEVANRNASLTMKRQAYVAAYIRAKRNLAEHFHGLNNASRQSLSEAITQIDSDEKSLANTLAVSTESIEQKVEGMIRGYVIYQVSDNPRKREVSVSLVTTPKTRGNTIRVSPAAILASDVHSGMKEVFAELKSGVIPPVGGRVISVPKNGGEQVFFVGFGSDISPINKNAAVERRLKQNARTVARMRAAANLCAIIVGDQVTWQGGVVSSESSANRQYENITKDDPISGHPISVNRPLVATATAYASSMSSHDDFRSAQSGKIPPGTRQVSWVSGDGDWVFHAYIYNPNLTVAAEKIREAMVNGPSIAERGSVKGLEGRREVGKPGDRKEFGNDRPIGKGPSGKVSSDKDL